MSKKYKLIAALADVHIGARHIPAEDLKQQLKEHFFKVVENWDLDGIFLLGDTFHTGLSLNSEYSKLAMWFFNKLYKLARKKHATVVVLLGTRSHDQSQLANIMPYVNNDDGVDFRIYETIEEITLWGDYKALVLPDIQVKQLEDVDQYLTKGKQYDFILGHGMIEQLQYVQQESENIPTKQYIYDAKKLMKACRGPVLFGHVHQYQHLDQKFYYVGPFTMLERGWQDAGFAVIGISDADHSKYKVEHYINPDSANYYNLVVTKKLLEEIPIDDIVAAIDDILAEAKPNDLITLRINRTSEIESADKVLLLENRYRDDKRISIVKKIKSKQEAEREQEHEEVLRQCAYLMDESLDLYDIAYQYYINDVKPTIPDQRSPEASLTKEDFKKAFEVVPS